VIKILFDLDKIEIVSEMPSFVNHDNLKFDALKNLSSKLFLVNLNIVCIFYLYGPEIFSADIVHGTWNV